ncbi:MAG: hypothetical protein H6824_24280 [Planctomycetaceae bacterium]|nr:hypothetical protein [Planctomycetaceae bacterium]
MHVLFTRCCFTVFLLAALSRVALPDGLPEALQKRLDEGDLKGAAKVVSDQLETSPEDGQARFAGGVVKVLQAVEGLAQDQYRHGAMSEAARMVPVFRLPLPENGRPVEITYAQVREIVEEFQRNLIEAEAELAKVDVSKEVKLPLNLSTIKLDLTGDGKATAEETFLSVFAGVNRFRRDQRDLNITFDSGDVPWLRGYCHFLCGFCDLILAYDHQELFDICGQLVYPRHVPSKEVLTAFNQSKRRSEEWILDLIAAIHLMDFPLKEPERMQSARGHFLEMIRTSRESWKLILAETDDDHEWLPAPGQTGALSVPVTKEQIDGWHGVLTEMEDLLEGRKLVPFWRDHFRVFGPEPQIPTEGRGVNLKKFFDEPADFDFVLIVQGSAMIPYLEEGPLSTPETWSNLQGVFGGRFFGFAMWFN